MSEATITAERQAGVIRLPFPSAAFRDAVLPMLGAAMVAFALAPTIVTPIPAMVDYLNHLARMDILSRAGTAGANPFYEAHWRLYPNLAMDLVVPYAAKFIGPIAATRAFLLLSQLLVLTGAMAVERVVKGRIALSPFFGCLFLYSLPFAFGFLNFEFGAGAALWGFAAMLGVDARGWRTKLAVHSAFCALLFVAHFCAFGIYGAVLGFYELSRIRSLRADFARALPRFLLLAAPAAPLLALYVLRGGAASGAGTIWLLGAKPMAFLHMLSGYNFPLSAISMLALCAGALYLSERGHLRMARPGVVIGLGFLALFILIPSRLFGTSFVDVRLLPVAALILPAFMTLRLPNAGWRIAAFGALSAAALANIALVMSIWTSYAPEYRT
ncbi:MAG TPA: hypothetical protein VNH64_12015, partial [Parvularculaceae bacterium]|nr:hypothetical protein [Parvularculaceae bacterium]